MDPWVEATRSEAAAILAKSAGQKAKAVGFTMVDGQRSVTFTTGPRAGHSGESFDAATEFELGSISKVFAGLLLADSVVRGEVGLADPASLYLPPDLRVPARAGRQVTLLDLASQAVSFPLMPGNWATRKTSYSRASFGQYLAGFQHSFAPGDGYSYSNVSTALLGSALEQRLGRPYGELLRERIFEPLGMSASGYADRSSSSRNVLEGHDTNGDPRPSRVDASPLGPCCIVRTTLGDLSKFMLAASGNQSPLMRAFDILAEPRHRIDEHERWATLGWVAYPRDGLLWKYGIVEGQVSTIVVLPAQKRALFVTANSEGVNIDRVASDLTARLVRPAARVDPGNHRQFVVPSPDAAMTPASAVFGNTIRLEGWVAPARARRAESMKIRLFFRVLAPPDRDWELFIHGDAVDGTAPRIAADHYPGHGDDSTTSYRPGELVIDDFELPLPPQYSAGALDVWLGFYKWHGRLPVTESNLETQDDRVRGPRIRIERTPVVARH